MSISSVSLFAANRKALQQAFSSSGGPRQSAQPAFSGQSSPSSQASAGKDTFEIHPTVMLGEAPPDQAQEDKVKVSCWSVLFPSRQASEARLASHEALNRSLRDAAATGDVETLALKLDQGAEINARDAVRQTALHRAAKANQAEAVDFLIKQGAFLHATDCEKMTPLALAVKAGQLEMADRLLAAGAGNYYDLDVFPILHGQLQQAVETDNLEQVQTLSSVFNRLLGFFNAVPSPRRLQSLRESSDRPEIQDCLAELQKRAEAVLIQRNNNARTVNSAIRAGEGAASLGGALTLLAALSL